MFIHVYFMFPETAGKPLEEVVSIFEDPQGLKLIGTPAWKTKSGLGHGSNFETGHHDIESAKGTVAHVNEKPQSKETSAPETSSEQHVAK